jgi:hypothetical protein
VGGALLSGPDTDELIVPCDELIAVDDELIVANKALRRYPGIERGYRL